MEFWHKFVPKEAFLPTRNLYLDSYDFNLAPVFSSSIINLNLYNDNECQMVFTIWPENEINQLEN